MSHSIHPGQLVSESEMSKFRKEVAEARDRAELSLEVAKGALYALIASRSVSDSITERELARRAFRYADYFCKELDKPSK